MTQLAASERGTRRLVLADRRGEEPREKVASFVAFRDWNWIVCGVVDRSEILAAGRRLAWSLFAGVLAMVALFGLVVRRLSMTLVVRPLERAVAFARAVARGDLSVEMEVERDDEFGKLAESHNEMVRSLRSVVEAIRSSSETLAVASDGMRASTEQAAQGATEQASSAEAASANIEQTSAAIESARSGEHGRAFAVVAQEVRKLADRSRAAAVEIVQLSSSSMVVAERAGGLLEKMVPDIQRTSELVREIAVASQQQAASLKQVSDSIQQLDKVIQSNASSAEELSATASGVAGSAEELDRAVGFFRTGAALSP